VYKFSDEVNKELSFQAW